MNNVPLTLTLALLACLSVSALAQDGPKGTESPAEEKKRSTDKQIAELVKKLQDAEGAQQKLLLEKLTKLLRERDKLDSLVTFGFGGGAGVVRVGRALGKETFRGAWEADGGGKGEYTLQSTGSGQYELTAKIVGTEGTESEIKDKGTFAQLRKKYTFLKNLQGVIMRGPAGVPGSASSGSTWPIRFGVSTGRTAKPVTKLVKEFGMTVRRPSTDLEYHLKLPAETSWIVEQVVPNSRAEKLGLKRFDVIAGADDEDLTEFSTLSRAKKRLSIVRRAKPSRIDITERTK